jgi:hypothetical protein
MALDIRRIELVPRPLEAVRFQGNDNQRRDILQWVQDKTPQGRVVLSSEALYIMGVQGTEKVEVGEWVLFDVTGRAFTSATDGAVAAFYRKSQGG